jgi:antitoxin YefM
LRPYIKIVIIMTMSTHSLAEAKAHLSELVGRVQAHHERVTVTVHGKPSAVLLAPDDLERMEETIAVLADSSLMKQLIDSESDLAAGRTESLQDVRETMRARGWSG